MSARTIGRYRVDGVIGAGGFGTVYRGTDTSTGRAVAIKVLDRSARDAIGDPLRAEAGAMLRVRDEHCVRVVEVLDEPGQAAIVTEYVDGASLRAVVQRNGPLDARQSLAVLRGALCGLAAVHAAGLVHGDVKPQNILVDRSGTSRLIDFGLAGPARRTPSTTRIGSPAYMSPEQARGEPLDERSDVYMCAAVLFELLTGRAPYAGTSARDVIERHLHHPVPDPRGVNPEVSEEVAAVCMRGLAKDPADRYASAAAFRAALEQAARRRYGEAWLAGTGLGAAVSAALDGVASLDGTASSGRDAAVSRRPTPRVRRPRGKMWLLPAAAVVGTVAVVALLATGGGGHRPTLRPTATAGGSSSTGRTQPAGGIITGSRHRFAVPSAVASNSYNAVSCPTARTCLATGQSAGNQPVLSRTTDGGATWQTSTVSAPAPLGLLSCSSASVCVAGYYDGAIHMVRTVDGGSSWQRAATPHVTNLQSISCPTAGACLAVGGLDERFGGTAQGIRTTDGGATWTSAAVPGPANSVSCPDVRHCWVSGATKVWTSGDLGATWRPVSPPSVMPERPGPYRANSQIPVPSGSRVGSPGFSELGVAFGDATHGIAFGWDPCGGATTGCSGGVWRTNDGGATWTFWQPSHSRKFFSVTYAACVGSRCLAVTRSFTTSALIDSADGATWSVRQDLGQPAGRVTCSADDATCVVIGRSGLWVAHG